MNRQSAFCIPCIIIPVAWFGSVFFLTGVQILWISGILTVLLTVGSIWLYRKLRCKDGVCPLDSESLWDKTKRLLRKLVNGS